MATGMEMPGRPIKCFPAKPSSAKLIAQAAAPGLCIGHIPILSQTAEMVWPPHMPLICSVKWLKEALTASLSVGGSAGTAALPSSLSVIL